MFELSRRLYRDLAVSIEAPVGVPAGVARCRVLGACEAAMARLADEPDLHPRVARWLFREIRASFGLADQRRVWAAVATGCAGAAEHVRSIPHGADPDGAPLRCRSFTRNGTPCRRAPLANGWCPSHQHLVEPVAA